MTFHSLQPAHIPLIKAPTKAFENNLLALAGEVGGLVADFRLGRPVITERLRPRLVSVMRQLIQAANESGVTMEAAAVKNLHKIFDLWPREHIYPAAFGADMDPEEQLPRRMTIDIYERTIQSRTYVYHKSGGAFVGDRLTDNAAEPDDYRFHNFFHYAHVTFL